MLACPHPFTTPTAWFLHLNQSVHHLCQFQLKDKDRSHKVISIKLLILDFVYFLFLPTLFPSAGTVLKQSEQKELAEQVIKFHKGPCYWSTVG